MHGFRRTWILGWVTAMVLATGTMAMAAGADGPGSVILATYNLENYVLAPTATRQAKTEASKARVAAVLAGLNADLVALQEVGGAEALEDLRGRLAAAGRAYEHREWVRGFDTNIQVALLSRFPIVERRPHTRDAYLLAGKRFFVSRGILEAEVAVNPTYRLTVFVAHLKSRRTSSEADEREMRREEARILREKIDERLKAEPRANVVVMGDLNDTKDSRPVRLLIGRGKNALFDTRPSERNGDTGFSPNPRWQPRTVAWTHFYGVEDTYGRVDYILLHPNAAREWRPTDSYVPAVPDWGLASDHRPVVIALEAKDR